MAGYLGTKAVLLSTTAADVIGNAEIGGNLTVGGDFTSTGIDDNASSTAMTLDGSQNVGIGTSSPSQKLQVNTASGNSYIRVERASQTTGQVGIQIGGGTSSTDWFTYMPASSNDLAFFGSSAERMRLDASGNLLVGKTSTAFGTAGLAIGQSGQIAAVRSGNAVADFNRLSTDGSIVNFYKDGSTVGSISADAGYLTISNGNGWGLNIRSDGGTPRIIPRLGIGASDNAIDLGDAGSRFDDVYATNGTIQTSDRNEKQDIDVLSDAEQRVAVACKGLLRKFRWNDAVAEKGDDARIHFGIIAQDLQDAFTAEGLDAGRYAMFISSTWWETQTEVPAVEAVAEVLDEDGNVVTEAVEAKEAYTRTDTYETLEEAPEGATERTRLGVRYPELLAFIIGAM